MLNVKFTVLVETILDQFSAHLHVELIVGPNGLLEESHRAVLVLFVHGPGLIILLEVPLGQDLVNELERRHDQLQVLILI